MVPNQNVTATKPNKGSIPILLLFFIMLPGLLAYMWVEVSLNTVLVQLYASGLETLVGEYAELAEHVELIGRIVSGFGLALAVATAIPKNMLALNIAPFVGAFSRRFVVFMLLWIVSVPALRITVDQLVISTSPETKLAAVRSLLFKEVLDRQMVIFDRAEAMNSIVADDERRKLLVALLPSLALMSTAVDSTIAAQTENMMVTLMERDQEAYFNSKIFPLYEQARAQYDKELKHYLATQKAMAKIRQNFTGPSAFKREFGELQRKIDAQLAQEWLVYQQGFDNDAEFVEPLVKRYVEVYRGQVQRLRKKSCDSNCVDALRQQWHDYMQNEIDSGRIAGLRLLSLDDEPWLYHKYLAGITRSFRAKLQDARIAYLEHRYPFDDDLDQHEFVAQAAIKQIVVQVAREQGYKVSATWLRSDSTPIRRSLQERARVEIDKTWRQYQATSKLKFSNRNMDKIDIAKHSSTRAMFKQILKEHYYSSYQHTTGREHLFKRWVASLDNANFVRMLTDATAQSAFAPGGMFYQIGSDAVRLSFIPPVAITASLFAIFSLLFQFGRASYQSNRVIGFSYFSVIGIGIVLIGTVGINHRNSYAMAMNEFIKQTVVQTAEPSVLDKATATLLGGIIDIEEWLLHVTGGQGLTALSSLVDTQAQSERPNKVYRTFEQTQRFDQLARDLVVISGQVEVPYDFNVAVIKRDERMGFYAGLNYGSDGQLEEVALPNILASKEVGYLLDQKWFLKPNPAQDALLLLQNYDSMEGWKEIKHMGRVSIRELLEQRALTVMQQSNNPQIKRIHNTDRERYNSLIFVQRGNGSVYECFQMPPLTIENLLQISRQQEIEGQSRFKCRGDLF